MVVGSRDSAPNRARTRARRGVVQHREQRASAHDLARLHAQRVGHARGRLGVGGRRGIGREIEHQLVVAPPHHQQAAARPERHLGPRRLQLRHQHERRRERRVPAQVDLGRRREPAQAEGIALGVKERRLREVVLGGDVLHQRLRDRRLERADGGRVTRERAVSEGVDLVQGERRHARRLPGRAAISTDSFHAALGAGREWHHSQASAGTSTRTRIKNALMKGTAAGASRALPRHRQLR